jgi:hypothetical protein
MEPAAPAKLSLNTVLQPGGAAGGVVADAGCDIATAATTIPPMSTQTAAKAVRKRLLGTPEGTVVGLVSFMCEASCPSLGRMVIHDMMQGF